MGRTPLGKIDAYDRPGENSQPPNLLLAIGHPPSLAAANVEFFRLLVQGDVSARDRKLATLSVAAVLGNGYEWGHHAPTAGRLGIGPEAVASIHDGVSGVLDEHDQLVVDFAAAVERQAVCDELWQRVAAAFTVEQQVQLTALAALYGFFSRIQVALQVDQDPGFDSLF